MLEDFAHKRWFCALQFLLSFSDQMRLWTTHQRCHYDQESFPQTYKTIQSHACFYEFKEKETWEQDGKENVIPLWCRAVTSTFKCLPWYVRTETDMVKPHDQRNMCEIHTTKIQFTHTQTTKEKTAATFTLAKFVFAITSDNLFTKWDKIK